MCQGMSQSELTIFNLLKGKLDEILGPTPELQIGLKSEASRGCQVLSQALPLMHLIYSSH